MNSKKIFKILVDILMTLALLLAMAGMMYSGVLLSRELRLGLTGLTFGRGLHVLSSYWGFVGIGLHIGLHWTLLLSRFPKTVKAVLGLLTLILGTWVLLGRGYLAYLLLQTDRIFLGQSSTALIFYLELTALLVLMILLAQCAGPCLKKVFRRTIAE